MERVREIWQEKRWLRRQQIDSLLEQEENSSSQLKRVLSIYDLIGYGKSQPNNFCIFIFVRH